MQLSHNHEEPRRKGKLLANHRSGRGADTPTPPKCGYGRVSGFLQPGHSWWMHVLTQEPCRLS